MNRRNFLKGLLFVGMLPLSGCMRPPEAKVLPAKLDCETAMSDSPVCSEPKLPLNAFEVQTRIEELYRNANVEESITYIPQQTAYLLNGNYKIKGKTGKWNMPEYFDGSTDGLLVARNDMKNNIINNLIVNGLYNG